MGVSFLWNKTLPFLNCSLTKEYNRVYFCLVVSKANICTFYIRVFVLSLFLSLIPLITCLNSLALMSISYRLSALHLIVAVLLVLYISATSPKHYPSPNVLMYLF